MRTLQLLPSLLHALKCCSAQCDNLFCLQASTLKQRVQRAAPHDDWEQAAPRNKSPVESTNGTGALHAYQEQYAKNSKKLAEDIEHELSARGSKKLMQRAYILDRPERLATTLGRHAEAAAHTSLLHHLWHR